MKVTVILLGGGSGKRMGGELPKQSMQISGKKIFRLTAERFSNFSCIDDIVFVGNKLYLEEYKNELSDIVPVNNIICGGDNRANSVYNGLQHMKQNPPDVVVIHDVVRPFVEESAVKKSVDAAYVSGAAVIAVPSVDTVIEVEQRVVVDIPDRSKLYNVQTPQTFRYDIIVAAHEEFLSQGGETTDDSRLVFNYGYPIQVVDGNSENIKITLPSDIAVAEKILTNFMERNIVGS